MRPKRRLRKPRPARMAVGALILATPASAVALTAGQANALGSTGTSPATPQGAPTMGLKRKRIAYGDEVTVAGTVSPSDAGQTLLLEYAPAGSSSWSGLSTTSVQGDGTYRLLAPLRESGLVRVLGASGASTASTSGGASIPPSPSQAVEVAARIRVPARAIDALGGQTVDVHGRLLPGVDGRRVRLEGRSGGGWRTIASARTRPNGRFDLRYVTAGTGQQRLRVLFAGDSANAGSSKRAGELTVLRPSVASWYDDAGSTACGFHAYYGVANLSLPCGTKVTFSYGGRNVTAVVDDRGPYVGGREWDLNQNTAAALGFGGVDTVWSSV